MKRIFRTFKINVKKPEEKLSVRNKIITIIPERVLISIILRIFVLFKIPLLSFIGPVVTEINEKRCVIKIPYKRRIKNHLGSVYFGVLASGADCVAGMYALYFAKKNGEKVSMAFKDFKADFIKRPEADTFFICEQGEEINDFVKTVLGTDQRLNKPLKVTATCPDKFGNEPIAQFEITLSLKKS